ncbi:hypothetical protein P4S70_11320 [Enterovibrio sp. Hal110]
MIIKRQVRRVSRTILYKDEVIDNLLSDFLLQTAPSAQRDVVNKLHLRIAEQQITVPLYYKLETVEYTSTRYKGWHTEGGKPAVPPIWPTERMRLIQLLDLYPTETRVSE